MSLTNLTGESRSFKPAMLLMAAMACGLCMEFYVANIWGAGQPSSFSDLFAPWWGAHELLLHGRNPYQPAVAHEIQSVIYGAPLPSTLSANDQLSGGFAYPIYAVFLMWPTVRLPFSLVQSLYAWVSISVTLGSVLLWLRAFHFRAPLVQWLTIALFAIGSFPVLQGIRLQNLSVIAAGTLALAVVLLYSERLTPAGILFAISTFKPQFIVLLIPWLALWSLSNWQKRQRLAWSFLLTMLLLLGLSEWMQPGWIKDFFRVVRAYKNYTYGHSLLDVWFTPRLGPFVAVALVAGVFVLCWSFREQKSSSQCFLLIISIMLAATATVIPTLAPHTQLLLLPGVFCLYRYRTLLWSSPRIRLIVIPLLLLIVWPWIAAALLTFMACVFTRTVALRWWEVPLYSSPLLPLAVLLSLLCLIQMQTFHGETISRPSLDSDL